MKLSLLILLLFFTTSSAFAQHYPRYSVIIHELFPDPSPSVGLPSSEFIELRNRSLQIINLKQWKISDGSSTATISSDTYLAPDSLIILCALSAQAQWADYGRTLGLSNFPSLNNEGDQLQLIGPDNNIVHAVAYTEKWYLNPVKALGGWTIEMIDPRQPCMGSENWRASNDSRGGTPGKLNSVQTVLADLIPPQPLRSITLDTQQILITFTETLDSPTASFSGHFNMDPHLPIADVQLEPPFYQTVKIRFKTAMQPNTVYTCSIKEVKDCAGNEMNKPVTLPVGLPSLPQKGDLILNELLFDPEPGKYDFVELYNRSKHILDLRELYLGRKSVAGAILDPIPISRAPFYLFPGSYIVITADAANLIQYNPSADPLYILEGALLPTMPDDKGSLALATGNGTLIDAVEYASSWHFPLLTKKEGVSLERIDPMNETQDPNNWTSAASLSGFATPTRQNSQFKNIQRKEAVLHVDPSAFSPDNDGYEDLLGLHYSLSKPGYLMQVKIYDAQGTMVAHPLPQATMPQKGTIWWNGTGTGHQLLPPGNYILWAELIHVGGKVSHFKQRVTLHRH